MLGAVAIVVPRFPRLKEVGLSASHAALGDITADIVAPLVFLALVLASWALRPASRTLAATDREAGDGYAFRRTRGLAFVRNA